MRKSFITRVDAWRFERPLAIALGASAMFMAMAVPPAVLPIIPALHIALALVAGLLLGGLGYAAMVHPWPRRAAAGRTPAEIDAAEEEQGHFAAAEVSLRLRRADRHPDAPVREPIFASRDLGSPFMDVGAFAPPADAGAADTHIPEGDFAEVDPTPPDAPHVYEVGDEGGDKAGGEDAVESVRFDPDLIVVEPLAIEPGAPVAAFEPDDEPVPAPARAPRESIAAMMERLSAGLERRAANGDGAALPRPREPALRDALAELNRLAARRG